MSRGRAPALTAAGADSVRLIDVIWLERSTDQVAAAFEVEHTTSIYSGIVRLLDLALGAADRAVQGLFLVASDDREADVRTQLQRPAFQGVGRLHVRFLRVPGQDVRVRTRSGYYPPRPAVGGD